MIRHLKGPACWLAVAAWWLTHAIGAEVGPLEKVEGWGLVVDPVGDCSFKHEDGKFTITVPGEYHDLWPGKGKVNAPLVLRDVEGDFTVEVLVARVDHAEKGTAIPGLASSTAFHAGTLVVWRDAKNFVRLDRTDMNKEGRAITSCYLHVFKDGQRTAEASQLIEDKPTRLRLERRGGRIAAAYSQDDGNSWRSFPSQRVELPNKLKAGISALNSTSRPSSAAFERLTITRAE